MKKRTALFLTLILSFSLAACGGQPANSHVSGTPGPQSPEATPEATPESGPSSDPVETASNGVIDYYLQKAADVVVTETHVTFTDDGSGEEITLEKGPKNVAVLYGSLACLWYEAGGTVQLAVGGSSAVTLYEEQIGYDFTQDEGVTIVTESSSSTAWDIETIIAGKPDLIICSTGMKGYETISGPAKAANIPVIGINYDAVQDYLKWFKVFCNLNEQPQLWDEVAEKTANEIIEIVSAVPALEKAPTAVILVISSDTLKAYTVDSQPGVILKELGGINLVDPDNEGSATSLEISLEDLYALDPDLIFYSMSGTATMDTLLDMVGDDPVWQALRAVQGDRVYGLEKGLFHNKANKRYNESYLTMAEYIYPGFAF